jgi:hypothetical protein
MKNKILKFWWISQKRAVKSADIDRRKVVEYARPFRSTLTTYSPTQYKFKVYQKRLDTPLFPEEHQILSIFM